MISHVSVTQRSRTLPDCPFCHGPVEMGSMEAVLSTNRGYRFPMILVQTSIVRLSRSPKGIEML